MSVYSARLSGVVVLPCTRHTTKRTKYVEHFGVEDRPRLPRLFFSSVLAFGDEISGHPPHSAMSAPQVVSSLKRESRSPLECCGGSDDPMVAQDRGAVLAEARATALAAWASR